MNKAEIFFDAITGIRPDLVEEALDYRFAQRPRYGRRWVQAAACLALVALVGLAALRSGIVNSGSGADNAACDMSTNISTATQEREGSTAFGDAPDSSPATSSGGDALLPDTDSKQTEDVSISGESVSRFTATVLEVHEGYLLVEPEAGESILVSADRIEVLLTGLEGLWDIQPGERVAVTWTGMILETYPARLSRVLELVPAE